MLALVASIPVYHVSPQRLRPYLASWMRRQFETNGTVTMKIGQWISSRTDLFCPDMAAELQHLQSNASPMDPEDVEHLLSINGLEFETFNPIPVSSGSIACVYDATYRGERVAVKIQRRGIYDSMVRDMAMMKWILECVHMIQRMMTGGMDAKMKDDMMATLEDIQRTITNEIDFDAEAQHMKTFRTYFDGSSGKNTVTIPRVIESTPTMIVMEYCDAIPYRGTPTQLLDIFFEQFFEIGWLHTDMHAGNVGTCPVSGNMVMFDFGSVICVPDRLVTGMKALMVSYLHKNSSIMLQYMLEYEIIIGTPSPNDMEMLESFVDHIVTYVEQTDIDQFINVMQTAPISQTPDISFSRDVFLMMRSFTLMEGLCKQLDDDFVIIDAIMPTMTKIMTDPFVIRLKIEDDFRLLNHLAFNTTE